MSDMEMVDRARKAEGFDVRMLAHGGTIRTRPSTKHSVWWGPVFVLAVVGMALLILFGGL